MEGIKERIREALIEVKHPEQGGVIESGIIRDISASDNSISLTLQFRKKRDPFGNSIKKQIEHIISTRFPEYSGKINISVKEAETPQKEPAKSAAENIKKIIAVSSGKGGVGKSTITANLAWVMHDMGYRVGILDADIYGPSQPKMFGVEDYQPQANIRDNESEPYILPADAGGIKISSIGFFISPGNALVWRGPMAVSALKQLIHQTEWGELDFLLIDLPPGTGDVHLSVIGELKIDGAVVVSTPQQVAVADAERGISMFRAKGVDIPVLGIIENMAWFTPAELPENKYYIFGKGGAKELAKKEGVDFLGDIPIIQSVMEGADNGIPASATNDEVKKHYLEAAEKIVQNLNKTL